MTVDWATSLASGDSAESGDFTAVAATALTFTAGQTAKTLTVATTEDTTDEEDETFTVTLSNPSSNAAVATEATAKGTIEDDDDPPDVGIFSASGTEAEAGRELVPTVGLSAESEKTVMVTWTASLETGDTAQPEDFVDLSAATGTVTLTPGTTSLALALYQEVLDDELDEEDETFTVTLSDPVNARVGRELASVDPAATMTIEDDDPEPTLSVQDAAASEGEDVEFTVTLDPASGRQVTVDWATSVATGDTATSGTDFTAVPETTLTFTAGQTAKTLTVDTTEEATEEEEETFTVTLSGAVNAVFAGDATTVTARGTIDDDDGLPKLSVAACGSGRGRCGRVHGDADGSGGGGRDGHLDGVAGDGRHGGDG